MYIYIHIPFCTKICNYCDFPKVLYDKKYIRNYLNALRKEIQSRYQGEKVKTIYIGGGTPTSLDLEEFTNLLELTRIFEKETQFEFTIESNIESLTPEKIHQLSKYGVNRVSLGVQSFQENTLKELGRNHNKKMIFETISLLKENKITNISIDYIYGVHQELTEIKKDLQTFFQLDIPHISCYSLIIEEGTIFHIQNRRYIKEEIEYQMYQYLEQELINHHYHHYEISNYALPGYESLHNLNYWNNGEYYGFGLGAVSFLNHIRISNTKSLTKYQKLEFLAEEIYEDLKTRISNEFIVGLRKTSGISIQEFYQKYQIDILTLYDIPELLQEGKLKLENSHLFIPPKYFYLANDILIHFLE